MYNLLFQIQNVALYYTNVCNLIFQNRRYFNSTILLDIALCLFLFGFYKRVVEEKTCVFQCNYQQHMTMSSTFFQKAKLCNTYNIAYCVQDFEVIKT